MISARYNQSFFEYVNHGAVRSAQRVLPFLQCLPINSVLDVGCGQGAWLSVWRRLGVDDVIGIDGDYVDKDRLYFPVEKFVTGDLRNPFDLGRQFDLAQCLEVAEHLPATSARSLVRSLTDHSDAVLFSAAAKGQGGENHINEQSYDYWREYFALFDFVPLDFLRPQIVRDEMIEPWYRYNIFLYVRRSRLAELPESLTVARVEKGVPLSDLSPMTYRIRKLAIRILPVSAVSILSRLRIAMLRRRDKIQG